MKFLVIGSGGQLGQEFIKQLTHLNYENVALNHAMLDITDIDATNKIVKAIKPDVVINCAAFNNVDAAEGDFLSAFRVNAIGVYNLALACKGLDCYFITFSTDYVFDGFKNIPYIEEDTVNPISQYGRSKMLGEVLAMQALHTTLVLRTSWLYGDGRQNFIYKLIQWANTQHQLQIADDEISVPTSTSTLVTITLAAIKNRLNGVYHAVNTGYCSRYEYASFVLRLLGIKKPIIAVNKEVFKLPAKRPAFSAMDNSAISNALNIKISNWEEALTSYLNRL